MHPQQKHYFQTIHKYGEASGFFVFGFCYTFTPLYQPEPLLCGMVSGISGSVTVGGYLATGYVLYKSLSPYRAVEKDV